MQTHNEKAMVELFVHMERELPVDEYVIAGIKVWPYIRLSIKNKLDSHFLINKGKAQQRTKLTTKQKLNALKNTFISFVQIAFSALKSFSFRTLFCRQPLAFLMFCFNSEYMSVGSREVNRNLVGIIDKLKMDVEEQDYEIWEYTTLQDVKHKIDFPGINISLLCATFNEWCRVRIALASFKPIEEYDFVEDVNQFLVKHQAPVKLESHKLRHEIARIDYLSRIIQFYLRRRGVKKVVNVCYYGYVGMAVNLACYRTQTLSIEYQHGVQTQYHPLYSNWTNVPDKGYELLPESFWVWGSVTKAVIEGWTSKQNFHQVKVVGNAWLSYFKVQLEQGMRLSEDKKQFYQHKKIILVSLQAFPEHFRFHVLEAMQKGESDWLWILKEHPRCPLDEDQIEQNFGELMQNGTVMLERDFSIYEMLTLLPVKVHLTAYSTVAFECEYYGVPTIFFHENGIYGNSNLINVTEHLFAALDADTLIVNIAKAIEISAVKPIYMAREITVVDELTKRNA